MNTITNTDFVSAWKSKGLSAESIKLPKTSDNSLTPQLNCYGTKTRVKFNGSCLQQSKISYTHSTTVTIYIVYELGASGSHDNDPTLKNCLFGAITLTKMQTLININILVMEMDLIDQVFHFQTVDLVKM